MALFTKLFDRSHDPYSIPGARWYKVRLKHDLDGLSVVSSDLPAASVGLNGPCYDVEDQIIGLFNLKCLDCKVETISVLAEEHGTVHMEDVLVSQGYDSESSLWYSDVELDFDYSGLVFDLFIYGVPYKTPIPGGE